MMNLEAKPGVGLGAVCLGMKPDTVKQVLGAPDEQVNEDDEVRLDYDLLKTSYFFGYDDSTRLHLIECKNPNLLVFGRKIIGTTASNLSQRLGFNGANEEINDYGDGECFHGFPGISCYSNSNTIHSVQVTLLFDEEDCVLWPSVAD